MPTHPVSPGSQAGPDKAAKRPKANAEVPAESRAKAAPLPPPIGSTDDHNHESGERSDSLPGPSQPMPASSTAAATPNQPQTTASTPALGPRFQVTSRPEYGWDLENQKALEEGKAGATYSLPIRSESESRGTAPAGELLTAESDTKFISKLRQSSYNTPDPIPDYKDSPYSTPELVIGPHLSFGRIWQVQEGELRLPIILGRDYGPPAPSHSTVRKAVGTAAKSRWYPELKQKDIDSSTDYSPTGELLDLHGRPVDPTRHAVQVAVKFACPGRARSPAGREWIEKHVLNEARIYSTNLRAISGVFVPAYYGLWTFRIGEDTVYMMILERLNEPRTEKVLLGREDRYIRPSTQRAICMAYTAIHRANIVTRRVIPEHLLVTTDPTTTARGLMEAFDESSSVDLPPSKPVNLRIIDFDEAVDVSGMPAEEREAAIAKERSCVRGSFSIWEDDWDEWENCTEVGDLWFGHYVEEDEDNKPGPSIFEQMLSRGRRGR